MARTRARLSPSPAKPATINSMKSCESYKSAEHAFSTLLWTGDHCWTFWRCTSPKVKPNESHNTTTTPNLRVCRAGLSSVRQLSHAVLSPHCVGAGGGYDALFHFEDLRRLHGSTILAMARSTSDVAHRPRGTELLHDRLLEPRQ